MTLAPKEAGEYTAKAIGILSQEAFTSLANPQVKKILEEFIVYLKEKYGALYGVS